MILAGTSERGCCPECGAPWTRELSERPPVPSKDTRAHGRHVGVGDGKMRGGDLQEWLNANPRVTVGWAPTCTCDTANPNEDPLRATKFAPVPCTVLDPFAGSATTMLVARNHGRHSIGIELNENYLEIARTRLQQLSLLA